MARSQLEEVVRREHNDTEQLVLILLCAICGDESKSGASRTRQPRSQTESQPPALRSARAPARRLLNSSVAQCLYLLNTIDALRAAGPQPLAQHRGDRFDAACVPAAAPCRLHSTERDLYYRAPQLFGTQRATHAALQRLCGWLSAARAARLVPPPVVEAKEDATDNEEEATQGESSETPARQGGAGAAQKRCGGAQAAALSALTNTAAWLRGRLAGAPDAAAPYTRESLGVMAAGRSALVGGAAVAVRLSSSSSSSGGGAGAPVVRLLRECGTEGLTVTSDVVARFAGAEFGGPGAASSDSGGAVVFVEKECVLRSLIANDQALTRHPRYAFLCSRGYPCIASRALLRRWHALAPSLPLAALADGDPHGLCIVLTLMGAGGGDGGRGRGEGGGRAGSKNTPPPPPSLASPLLPVRWIGVRPSRVGVDGACIPLAASDVPLLHSLQRRLDAALASLSQGGGDAAGACNNSNGGASAAAAAAGGAIRSGSGDMRDEDVVRQTLTEMRAEAAWMLRARLKCEIQQAVRPPGNGGGGGGGGADPRPASAMQIIHDFCAPLLERGL